MKNNKPIEINQDFIVFLMFLSIGGVFAISYILYFTVGDTKNLIEAVSKLIEIISK